METKNKRNSGKIVLSKRQNLLQGFKFLIFSAGAGIIQALTLTLLNEFTKAPPWLAYLSGLILSVLFNFTVNRKFTFKSASNVPIAMLKVAAYYAVFTPLSTFAVKYFAPDGASKLITYAVSFGSMAANLITEFLFYRFVVYRNSMYTNESGRKEMESEKGIVLREITEENLGECEALKRKSNRFVGSPLYVIAEAYVHRENTTAHAIYTGDKIVGLVCLIWNKKDEYSFTNLFISDDNQGRGFGKQAVKAIIEIFRSDNKHSSISIFVHNTNKAAINIYESCGFSLFGKASWDENFLIMKYTF